MLSAGPEVSLQNNGENSYAQSVLRHRRHSGVSGCYFVNTAGFRTVLQFPGGWFHHHQRVREQQHSTAFLPDLDQRFSIETTSHQRGNFAADHGEHEPAWFGMVRRKAGTRNRVHDRISISGLQDKFLLWMQFSGRRPGTRHPERPIRNWSARLYGEWPEYRVRQQ